MKDDELYLIHIIETIARIEEYTRHGKDAFALIRSSSKTQFFRWGTVMKNNGPGTQRGSSLVSSRRT